MEQAETVSVQEVKRYIRESTLATLYHDNQDIALNEKTPVNNNVPIFPVFCGSSLKNKGVRISLLLFI